MKFVLLLLVSCLPSFAVHRARIHNYNGSTLTNVPITFKTKFAIGVVPSGSCAQFLDGATPIPTQVDVDTYHSDGSIQVATLSAVTTTNIAVPFTDYLVTTVGTPCDNTGFLTKAQLQAFNESSGGAANGWNMKIDVTAAATTVSRSCRTILNNWDGVTIDDRMVSYARKGNIVTEIILKDLNPDTDLYSFGWHNIAGVMTVDGATQYKSLTPECHVSAWHSLNQVEIKIGLDNMFQNRTQSQLYSISYYSGPTETQLEYTKASVVMQSNSRNMKLFWTGAGNNPIKRCTGGTLTGMVENSCILTGGTLGPKYIVGANLDYLSSSGVGVIPKMRTGYSMTFTINSYYTSWALSDKGDLAKGWHVASTTGPSENWVGEMEGSIWTKDANWYWLTMDDGGAEFAQICEVHFGYSIPGGAGNQSTSLSGLKNHFIEYGTSPTPTYCGTLCTTPANQMLSSKGRWITMNSRPTANLRQVFNTPASSTWTSLGWVQPGDITTSTGKIATEWAHTPDLATFYWFVTSNRMQYDALMNEAHAALIAAQFNVDSISWPYGYTWLWGRGTVGTAGNGNRGFLWDGQLRGRVWMLHYVTHAAIFARDGSPEKEYIRNKLLRNIAIEEGQFGITTTTNYDPTCIASYNARTYLPLLATDWCWGRITQGGRDNSPNPTMTPMFDLSDDPIGSFGMAGYSLVNNTWLWDPTLGGYGGGGRVFNWFFQQGMNHWVQLGFVEWNECRRQMGKHFTIPYGGFPGTPVGNTQQYTSPGSSAVNINRIRVMNITKANPAVVETETPHNYHQCGPTTGTTASVGISRQVTFACTAHTYNVDDWVYVSGATGGGGGTNLNRDVRVIATTANTVTVLGGSGTVSGSWTNATIRSIIMFCCPRIPPNQWALGYTFNSTNGQRGMVATTVDATHFIPSANLLATFNTTANTLDFDGGCGVTIGCNVNDERQRTWSTKVTTATPFTNWTDRQSTYHPQFVWPVPPFQYESYTAKYTAALAGIADVGSDEITGVTWLDAWTPHNAAVENASWAIDPRWAFLPIDSPPVGVTSLTVTDKSTLQGSVTAK